MAKRESKLARIGSAISEWLGDRLAAVDAVTRAWLLRSTILTLAIAGLIGMTAWGLRRLERTVHARENFQQPLTLEWIDLRYCNFEQKYTHYIRLMLSRNEILLEKKCY